MPDVRSLPMRISEEDLTAVARIRNAALEGFVRDGVEATSIRDVAAAAGVSPGLVQHHFKTKADLEQAVNEYVLRVAAEAYAAFEEETTGAETDDLLCAIGDFITAFVRDHHTALVYVIKSAANGEKAGLGIFNAFISIVSGQVDQLAELGTLRPDIDRLWLTLHVVIFNLGTVLLEPAITPHLAGSLWDPAQLERWNEATTDLLDRGVIRT
jgi:TetR/AcrR family transcriptional regulator, regulator of cefoperazone and chloramphenicol sensitivity